MSRAPYQVLVLPFRISVDGIPEYAALRRSDDGRWQGVAGGGRTGELPIVAARREAIEEAGTPADAKFYALQSVASIPTCHFPARAHWPQGLYVVPEYAFAVDCGAATLSLSKEHTAIEWDTYSGTRSRLFWDSNRVALWELSERIGNDDLPSVTAPA